MHNLKALQDHFEKLKAHIIAEEAKLVVATTRPVRVKAASKRTKPTVSTTSGKKLVYVESEQKWEWIKA
jgi:hypothetical protein